MNEAPVALDIIKSADGQTSQAIVRLEGSDGAYFELDKVKKQIEKINIGAGLIEAKPASF